MLEQWEADQLLHSDKVYSHGVAIDLAVGCDSDYNVEAADGTAFFLLDVWRSKRNPSKARFQLRYQRDIVIARLCTSVEHSNPDGQRVGAPHFHTYHEHDADKWAEDLDPMATVEDALLEFCRRVNLPAPEIQGGVL